MNQIESFQINEPIKGLFRPKFSVESEWAREHHMPGMVNVKLTIQAKDAFSPEGRVIEVALVRSIEREIFERGSLLAEFMRRMLHELIAHEIDESISWNGVRVFDPHSARGQWGDQPAQPRAAV